jgi:ribonucleoside-diphosphate reductase alpha chain
MEYIRPAGVKVNNAAITSTGIVPFMERYSNTTREVAQGGRRGALMLTVSIEHPESENFIDAKMDTTKVTGANISVKISDSFMEAASSQQPFLHRWPIGSSEPIVTKESDANTLWKKIIHNAWKSAEPGVLFWDRVLSESPADCYAKFGFRTVSTNPCGELPLCTGDSCRLLVLNLYAYVMNPFTSSAKFDYELFKKHAMIAQRMMDDIVDLEIEKIDSIISKIKSDPESTSTKRNELEMWEEIRYKCESGRRTGTGVTGEGDMLAAMGLIYGTSEATNFSTDIHRILAIQSYKSSAIMASERGTFPLYDAELEKENPFIVRLRNEDAELDYLISTHGRRNIANLTIAPAGSVSILTRTTSGVECAFAIRNARMKKVNANDANVKVDFVDATGDAWEKFYVFHDPFRKWLEVNRTTLIESFPDLFAEKFEISEIENFSAENLDRLIQVSPYHKALSNDVDWVEKVKMQGSIQKWIDHSISVTVNLPNNVTEELVEQVYFNAWKAGCKGCTIYRDGCRTGVLINEDKKAEKREEIAEEVKRGMFTETKAPKRPKILECDIYSFMNKGERWIGLVGLFENKPYEVWTGPSVSLPIPTHLETAHIIKNKVEGVSRYDFVYEEDGETKVVQGINVAFDVETHDISKTFSAILRHGMPLPYVVQLIESLHLDGDLINTWKNGFKRMIKKYIQDGTVVKQKANNCPNSGENVECNLVYQEGCLICTTCGNSKC